MPTVTELVRAKNVDLLVHQYNAEVKKLNKDGFLNKDSKEFKDLRNKYENLIARFDTDKNTQKRDGEYNYNIALDSTQIIGIKGIRPTLKIRSK